MKTTSTYRTIFAASLASGAMAANLHGQSADALINKLVEKGILTQKEATDLAAESTSTNQVSSSKWHLSKAIKDMELFGDVRFRYEYRGVENAPSTQLKGPVYDRERFRYAVRVGVRGELFDDFYYGLRLETAPNPRSPWLTFGANTGKNAQGSPSGKDDASINVGQVYLGWKPADWYEMVVGKMPMPLYITPMVWDSDINPEGAVEKIKYSFGDVGLFANFGQFVYQHPDPAQYFPSSDTIMLAWQLGGSAKIAKDVSVKAAPVLYNYTGIGSSAGLNSTFTGEGGPIAGAFGGNPNTVPFYNQNGINNLLVLEVPAEVNFKLGKYNARLFGDFGYNLDGDGRAEAAYAANHAAPAGNPATLPHAFLGEDKAYMAGFGLGNLGLVYGSTSKKGTWEARAYWQHVEQYALDVNLLDSDFFEGRGNLQGIYSAFAYSLTDGIILTARYGYAQRINDNLGTGGYNLDLPALNPIRNYHLVQLDVTWRF